MRLRPLDLLLLPAFAAIVTVLGIAAVWTLGHAMFSGAWR